MREKLIPRLATGLCRRCRCTVGRDMRRLVRACSSAPRGRVRGCLELDTLHSVDYAVWSVWRGK